MHQKPWQDAESSIPTELLREITRHARSIAKKYRCQFWSDPNLKETVVRLERALLPPRPRPRGRPGNPMVTDALKLRAQFRRQFPEETPRQICQRVYVAVIDGYANMQPTEQREARELLQQRMIWRRRKRRPRKNR
jgi:hypothetical protein